MVSSEDAIRAQWVSTALAIVILLARLAISRYSLHAFDISSVICVAAVLVVIARAIFSYIALQDGTANDVLGGHVTFSFNAADPTSLKLGSIAALVARLLATTFYWLQICLLLTFYSRLLSHVRWIAIAINICWFSIVATYIVVILTTFLECRPFRLYWQFTHPPDRCVFAYMQTFAQGVSNILLDLILLAIAFPLINVRNRAMPDAIRICTLVALGFFCIITSCLRLVYVYDQNSFQPTRSLWASIQIIVSSFVANAPTIYGSLVLIRRKRFENITRTVSRPEVWVRMSEASSPDRRPELELNFQS